VQADRIWARPNDQWRISYDMELFYSDGAFTRISPRHRQQYKARASYQPVEWANVAATLNILNQRNNVDQIFHKQHTHAYAISASLMPESWWGFDVGYDFTDIESNTNICFTLTTTPLPPGSGPCPVTSPAQTTFAISDYDNNLHFGFLNVVLKPVKRVTTYFGYNVVRTTGDSLILGPINAPRGTLTYTFYRPSAGIDIMLSKYATLKSTWGFYGYNEKDFADPFTSPVDSLGRLVGRDFRGNLFTTSVRFTF
jgi:hypothetical protein